MRFSPSTGQSTAFARFILHFTFPRFFSVRKGPGVCQHHYIRCLYFFAPFFDMSTPMKEAQRLEELWSGAFGDALTDRHVDAVNDQRRKRFWQSLLQEFPVETVLEVGCNQAFNLEHMIPPLEQRNVYGMDINAKALAIARKRLPDAHFFRGPIKDIPYKDRMFDMTISAGVLIHQPEESLRAVISELARCSRKYVVLSEYHDTETVEVTYRGERDALFRRDYGKIFLQNAPGFTLVKEGFHGKDEGWDDETFYVFVRK